jgi:uncharacterized C2H2 Zn-finger protein
VQFLDCPRCRARFHTGLIYLRLEACPRCGASFAGVRSGAAPRLRRIFGRDEVGRDATDWETITGSQYSRGRET